MSNQQALLIQLESISILRAAFAVYELELVQLCFGKSSPKMTDILGAELNLSIVKVIK